MHAEHALGCIAGWCADNGMPLPGSRRGRSSTRRTLRPSLRPVLSSAPLPALAHLHPLSLPPAPFRSRHPPHLAPPRSLHPLPPLHMHRARAALARTDVTAAGRRVVTSFTTWPPISPVFRAKTAQPPPPARVAGPSPLDRAPAAARGPHHQLQHGTRNRASCPSRADAASGAHQRLDWPRRGASHEVAPPPTSGVARACQRRFLPSRRPPPPPPRRWPEGRLRRAQQPA